MYHLFVRMTAKYVKKNRKRFDRGEIDANGNEVGPRFNYQNAGGGGFGGAGGGGRGRAGGPGGGGFSAEDIFGDFSSVFENMRGGGAGGSAGGRRQTKGQDRAYKIDVDFLDAARGDKRRITLPNGKSLNVTIPAGIEDGKQMVPRKLTITYKNEPESPQYIAVLSEWDLDARLPEALFNANLTSTANLEKIEFLDLTKKVPSKLGEGE